MCRQLDHRSYVLLSSGVGDTIHQRMILYPEQRALDVIERNRDHALKAMLLKSQAAVLPSHSP